MANSESLTTICYQCSVVIFSVSSAVFILLTILFQRGICITGPEIRDF
jgi:hypothetical protein